MALLGFLAAGAAGGYAEAKNRETETRNRIESAVILREMEQEYQDRAAERAAKADEIKYQRDVERDDIKFERDRAAKKEDFGMSSEHDLKKLETKHKFDSSLEGMRQSSAERRTRINQEGAMERAKLGLLNTGSRGSGNANGGLSQKDIARANEADRKRIFDLKKELTSPMTAKNVEQNQLLKQEIMRLEDSIAERLHGNPELDISAILQ